MNTKPKTIAPTETERAEDAAVARQQAESRLYSLADSSESIADAGADSKN